MLHRKPNCKVLDERLWKQSGVVYARTYKKRIVYVGCTDGVLSKRIRRHVRLIATTKTGTAPRYREAPDRR
jgi:hypothetical protein